MDTGDAATLALQNEQTLTTAVATPITGKFLASSVKKRLPGQCIVGLLPAQSTVDEPSLRHSWWAADPATGYWFGVLLKSSLPRPPRQIPAVQTTLNPMVATQHPRDPIRNSPNTKDSVRSRLLQRCPFLVSMNIFFQ